jgi:hydroxyethylthiazole kinase-like sugar kinase family protein
MCRVAGEIAAASDPGASQAPGPGTARVKLLDALYKIGEQELKGVEMKAESVA